MSARHTPGPKPLTQRKQRVLDRLQIKWSKKTITAEEKAHALALGNRAWIATKAAEAKSYETRIADTNAKTNAAMTPKERRASDRICAALAKAIGAAS